MTPRESYDDAKRRGLNLDAMCELRDGMVTPRSIREQAIRDLQERHGDGAAWAWEHVLRCESAWDMSIAGLFRNEAPPQGFRVEWDLRLVPVPVGCRL